MASRSKKKRASSKSREILAIACLSGSILLFLGVVAGGQYLGEMGRQISETLMKFTLGYPFILVPVILHFWGWAILLRRDLRKIAVSTLYAFGLMFFVAIVLSFAAVELERPLEDSFAWGGIWGRYLAEESVAWLGILGSGIVFLTAAAMLIVHYFDVRVEPRMRALLESGRTVSGNLTGWTRRIAWPNVSDWVANLMAREEKAAPEQIVLDEPPALDLSAIPESETYVQETTATAMVSDWDGADIDPDEGEEFDLEFVERAFGEQAEEGGDEPDAVYDASTYQFPPIDILEPPPPDISHVTKDECLANATVIEEKLADFGVKARVVKVIPGPVITLYEVNPAPGVKISRIEGLQDDLALAMKARGIRIIAPIPGKDVVGIEVPNNKPELVGFRSVLHSEKFRNAESKLTVVFGKAIDGEVYTADLAEMPHLLIAGSTGSGKSVGINTIIASILFRALPDEVQFVLIDPKRIELSMYNKLKHHHLLRVVGLDETVITNVENAKRVLRGLEREMEERYSILARAGVRNIGDFNRKIEQNALEELGMTRRLPFIVVIVDELADLMMTGGKEAEEPIARLAAMSRAVGIHLVMATQRPSVDVLTGMIKANFSARIAYQVATRTDSRTILDMNGADQLLGKGDMLFLPPGQSKPVRIQNAFLSTEEIERMVDHIARQPRIEKPFLALPDVSAHDSAGPAGGVDRSRDAFFNDAAILVIRHQQGSVSLLQRRLKIGYARAGRLIDQLEMAGIVGPNDGSKARQVLHDESYIDEMETAS